MQLPLTKALLISLVEIIVKAIRLVEELAIVKGLATIMAKLAIRLVIRLAIEAIKLMAELDKSYFGL